MIICTQNFQLFDDARKFASYAGIAPFEHTSGSCIKGATHTSKYRNKDNKYRELTLRTYNPANPKGFACTVPNYDVRFFECTELP
ncbi:MAG: hypothetical protein ACI81Y_001676 [Glaciecola sp.]|jgi:hypothetical protein